MNLARSMRGAGLLLVALATAPLLWSTRANAQAFHLTFDDECNSLSIANEDTYGDSGPKKSGTYEAWYRSHPTRHLSTGEQEEFVDPSFSGFPNQAADPLGLNPFQAHHGIVSLIGNPAPAADFAYLNGQKYTSGLLSTYSSFSQLNGYFVMRAKLPQGPGLWPAFWMLPTTLLQPSGDLKWQYEIDVLEAFGEVTKAGGGPNQVHWALHQGSAGAGGWATVPGNIYTGFHNYGVDWEPYPGDIAYYFDGHKIGSAPTSKDMTSPMFMIACLAMGGTWMGPVDPSSGEFPAKMDIDYIRAYSKDPNIPAVKPQAGYSPSPTSPVPIVDAALASPDASRGQ